MLIDGEIVETTTVSSKYQVVIPKKIREVMGLKPGEKFRVLLYQNRIELLPVKPMRTMRGYLRGINTDISREKDRI